MNSCGCFFPVKCRATDPDGKEFPAHSFVAGRWYIPKISMDGLADYSRNGGYVQGNVEITNETVKFNYDRGRKFSVDAMDNEETAGLAFGKLASEFIRTKAVPEMDAVRFASYAAINGIGSKTETISGAEAPILMS